MPLQTYWEQFLTKHDSSLRASYCLTFTESTQRPLAIKLGYLELEPMRPQVSMSCMFHFGH
ncbi:hypothetical protein HMPREF2772_18475 [Achromobacter xylosoxidans]|nr:hypothetical protein HMPREF2772_18475 [Achromobacter xylosoxidans]